MARDTPEATVPWHHKPVGILARALGVLMVFVRVLALCIDVADSENIPLYTAALIGASRGCRVPWGVPPEGRRGNEHTEQIPLFRYEMIREAAASHLGAKSCGVIVHELAAKEHQWPFAGTKQTSLESLDLLDHRLSGRMIMRC